MENFNLGRHIDDQDARQDAMRNREKLCQALNLDYQRLVVPGQVHSSRVVSAEEQTFAQVDAIATGDANRPILLHFADCVPIILFDPSANALAVVHAGWKGTAGKIVKNAVEYLRANHGSKPENIVGRNRSGYRELLLSHGQRRGGAVGINCCSKRGMIIWADNPRPDLKAINAMQLLNPK